MDIRKFVKNQKEKDLLQKEATGKNINIYWSTYFYKLYFNPRHPVPNIFANIFVEYFLEKKLTGFSRTFFADFSKQKSLTIYSRTFFADYFPREKTLTIIFREHFLRNYFFINSVTIFANIFRGSFFKKKLNNTFANIFRGLFSKQKPL